MLLFWFKNSLLAFFSQEVFPDASFALPYLLLTEEHEPKESLFPLPPELFPDEEASWLVAVGRL